MVLAPATTPWHGGGIVRNGGITVRPDAGARARVTARHACVTTVREAPRRLAVRDVQCAAASSRTGGLVVAPERLARLCSVLIEAA